MAKEPWRESEGAEKVFRFLTFISSALCLLALGYLAWLFINDRFVPASYKSAEALASLQQALGTLGYLLGIGLWLLVAVSLLRWPGWDGLGWILLALGGVLYLGGPVILSQIVHGINLSNAGSPGKQLLDLLQIHGVALLCVGGARIAVGLVLTRAFDPALARVDPTSEREPARSLTHQCWELAACHKARRKDCPSYLAHMSCWKTKKGCYCNKDVAQVLMNAAKSARRREAVRMKPGEQARQAAAILAAKEATKEFEGGCKSCALYMEHQRYKSRIALWIIFPAAAVVTWLMSGAIQQAWHALDVNLSRLLGHVSVLNTPDPERMHSANFATMDVSWVVVLVVGLVMVTVAAKISEYLLYKVGV